MARVLIVDDDPVQLKLTSETAARGGFSVTTASGGREALEVLRSGVPIGAVVLDLVMPDLDGMAVLETMSRERMTTPVVIQTAHSSLETITSATQLGAVDFFTKPVSPERLLISLRNVLKLGELETAVRADRNWRGGALGFGDLVTRSPALERVNLLARKAAKSTLPVLVEGEAGVGKELVARIIHGSGDRAGKPFVTLNCSAVPVSLLEAILFGQRRNGSSAPPEIPGKFAEAHGGTLFLDEVGELSPAAQMRLLRAIQHGEIEPVGATKAERVNVRVIAATSRRLLNLAKSGAVREDLYYRLNVLPMYVPPLRDRREDIAPLAARFIARFGVELGCRTAGISADALALLQQYDWPGNVRQLENTVYRAVALAAGGQLQPADFPQLLNERTGRDETSRAIALQPLPLAPVHIDVAAPPGRELEPTPAGDRFLDAEGRLLSLAAVERDLIAFAIAHHGGRMSRVARALGIGRSTLYRKLHEYGLAAGLADEAA